MNLKQLKYFKVIAQELNFGLAAEKLYIDQSALSRAIQSLESTLGVTLFERQFRQLKLTEQGLILLQEASHIFYLIDNINHRVKSTLQKKSQIIELAISPNIDGYRIAELLQMYREACPQIHLNIHENSYKNILCGLQQGQYHTALTLHKPNQDHKSLGFRKLWQEKLIVLLSKLHPLTSSSEVKLEDLKKYPFISFEPDTLLFDVYTNAFNPPSTLFVKSYSILQSLVMAGYGISLVTENMFNNMKNNHIITRPIETPLLVDTYLIYQQDRGVNYEQIKFIKKLFSNAYLSNSS